MTERNEAFIRIIITIISGFILGLWKAIIQVLVIIHWIYVVIYDKRNRALAEFCNIWNTQIYRFLRYVTFTTNERPFPFTPLGEVKNKIVLKEEEIKKKK